MGRLADKVAVAKGANSGMVLAIAGRFVKEGAHVFMTGRRQAELDKAVGRGGDWAVGIQGDVADLADHDRLYETVRNEAGVVDIVTADAGDGGSMPLDGITEGHLVRAFGSYVQGTFSTVQKDLPLFRDGGSTILIGSIAGMTGMTGMTASSVHSASKRAIRSSARSWSLDLGARRIRVNGLAPGATFTPDRHPLAGFDQMDQEMLRQTEAAAPLRRIGQPYETAFAALLLASDDSSYVSGSEPFVDCGSAQI